MGIKKRSTSELAAVFYQPATSLNNALVDVLADRYEKYTSFKSALAVCENLNREEPTLPPFHVFKISIVAEKARG